jgi:hypothetical protein
MGRCLGRSEVDMKCTSSFLSLQKISLSIRKPGPTLLISSVWVNGCVKS